jgi:arylsulfatase A-like enzyme
LHLQPHLYADEPYHYESGNAWKNGTVTADWNGPFYGFEHAEFINGHHEKNQLSAGHYADWIRRKDPALVEEILRNPPEHPHQLWASPIPQELHHTTWLAERFDAWLGSDPLQQPFCGFIGFPGPHHPFAPSHDILPEFQDWEDPGIHDSQAKFLQNSGYALYAREPEPPKIDFRDEPEFLPEARRHTAAMIRQIDLAVGRILDSLDQRGLRENTIIIFTSDHGDFLGNHHMLFKHMGACRDLMNVPFLLSGPGIEPGSTDDQVMSSIDVLPTLAAMAGVTPPAFCPGRDRSVPGSGEGHRAFGVSYNSLISGANHRLDNYSVMDGRYRATFYPRQGFTELTDYQQDPWETQNLADAPEHAERLRAFRAEIAEQILLADLPARERSMYF